MIDDVLANPLRHLKDSIIELILNALRNRCITDRLRGYLYLIIQEPPRKEFGDLAIPLPRLLTSCRGMDLRELASLIINSVGGSSLISRAEASGSYLNFFINTRTYGSLVLKAVRELGDRYGVPKADRPKRIVVEFVSANPIHPLHIGSGRNAVIGDFISRLLIASGHEVERRYYVDDVGLQTAYLAYGYLKLGKPEPPSGIKPDHYYGMIYAATVTVIDVLKLRNELQKAKELGDYARIKELNSRVDELMAHLQRLRDKVRKEVDKLIDELSGEEDPEASVKALMKAYEAGRPEASVIREVAEKVLEGIKETLQTLGVNIDRWDWESDLFREGLVRDVLGRAKEASNYVLHKGVPALDFKYLLQDKGLREKLRVPKGLEVPPLILVREDGSTLYTTRDIAYTLKKFKEFRADEVINVIAVEQTLPQTQLRLALHSLGFRREAENTIHYSYEMVRMSGASMSSRRGVYVTVDEVIGRMNELVKEIMQLRGGNDDTLPLKVARSAFRYMMLSTTPSKVLVFDISRALDRKQLSGPYLQYTYARAASVLRKANGVPWDKVSFEYGVEGLRRDLLWLVGAFPEVMSKTLEKLEPDDLIGHLNRLSDTFNRWYDQEPIAKEPNEVLRALKLFITEGVRLSLKVGMGILGMDVLERI